MEVLECNETTGIQLTEDQQAALAAFQQFLIDPDQQVFVLSGYSGCGKTTLLTEILKFIDKYEETINLIAPDSFPYGVALCATTNKAAENISNIVGLEATTIHSFMGLIVETDYATQTQRIKQRYHTPIENTIIFIDEASYIDEQLLQIILKRTKESKVVFIGDPAQLTPVKCTKTPVFEQGWPEARLTQVVRQQKLNPIIELSTLFRETVNTGEFFSFVPDGHHIQHLDRDAFNTAIEQEFSRPDWKYYDSKILAWTNKKVVAYNSKIRQLTLGRTEFHVGDYAISNSFVMNNVHKLKADETVLISAIYNRDNIFGVPGRYFALSGYKQFFVPDDPTDIEKTKRKAQKEKHAPMYVEACRWADLRAAYACTINKAQGSTFDKVFIDLDDIRKCNNGNQIARMLYVAVSRAKHHVYFTGDIA